MPGVVLHALEDIDDAIAATRSLLVPIDIKQWLKLAFIAFFIGGPAGDIVSSSFNGPRGMADVPITPNVPDILGDIPRVAGLVIAIVAVVLVVGVLFVLIGSVMEFVFVESIRTERVTVRETWSERWRQGVRLFGFRLGLGLLFGGIVAVLGLFIMSPIVRGPTGTGLSIVLIILLLPIALAFGLGGALVNTFTTLFVVPIMLMNDCGVLSGWRPLWASIKGNPWQYAAFALVGFLLFIAAGIIVGIVVLIPAFILLLPVAPIAIAGFSLVHSVPILGALLLIVAAIVYGVGLLAIAAIVQVPVLGFIRYYAMLVLGDIEPDLDAIPDIRASIRGEEAG